MTDTVTMKMLEAKMGRKVSLNEWRVANGKTAIRKIGRKTRHAVKFDRLPCPKCFLGQCTGDCR